MIGLAQFPLYETAATKHSPLIMPDPSLSLDFQIALAGWQRIPHLRAKLKKAAQAVHTHIPAKFRFNARATVLLSGNAKIRQLNHDFRGMDKPTNVLSFPQFDPKDLPKAGKNEEIVEIGDIALALQVTTKEAKLDNKPLINHVTHLVIHGLLHLYGYDHGDDHEAEAMEKLEIKIMKALELPNPYAPLFDEKKIRK